MINPSIAPKPAKDTIPPAIEIYKDLLFSFVPLTVLIITVLGSILGASRRRQRLPLWVLLGPWFLPHCTAH